MEPTVGLGQGFTMNAPVFVAFLPSGMVRKTFHFPRGTSFGIVRFPVIFVGVIEVSTVVRFPPG